MSKVKCADYTRTLKEAAIKAAAEHYFARLIDRELATSNTQHKRLLEGRNPRVEAKRNHD